MEITGLRYISNFIFAEQEAALLDIIDRQNWRTDLKRRVQHYGYVYDYRARTISKDMRIGPLPQWLIELSDHLMQQSIFETRPDQVIVNEYVPGQGISPHIDCVPCFGNVIASLSLGSAVTMNFLNDGEVFDLRLEPKSLLVLKGEARMKWQHAIAGRKSDLVSGVRIARSKRVSLTFRTVKIGT